MYLKDDRDVLMREVRKTPHNLSIELFLSVLLLCPVLRMHHLHYLCTFVFKSGATSVQTSLCGKLVVSTRRGSPVGRKRLMQVHHLI